MSKIKEKKNKKMKKDKRYNEKKNDYIEVRFDVQYYPKKNQKSNNGFSVVRYICQSNSRNNKLAVDENNENLFSKKFTAVGFHLPSDDLLYKIYGKWKIDPKYGRRFEVDSFTPVIEQTKTGITNYLTTLDGIGDKIANRIYQEFKEKTFDVLENEPKKLLKIKGISPKKLDNILDSYNSKRGSRDVVVELAPLGLSVNNINRLYQAYGADTVNKIKDNPFIAMKHIGFERANALAIEFNMPDYRRIVEAMYYTLSRATTVGALNTTSGSCFMYLNDLILEVQNLLELHITNELFEKAIPYIVEKGIYFTKYKEDIICYRNKEYKAEETIVRSIKRLLNSSKENEFDAEEILSEVEEDNFKLYGQQKEAVIMALNNDLSVITGGPGTGKTTIINFVVESYKRVNPNNQINLLAPTGRAAKKLSESTNRPASTIHKALGLTPVDSLEHSDLNTLEGLVIIDEASMLDLHLASALLRSIETNSKVVFVGDVDQLPSIGPGAVLKNIIDSKVVPSTKLTKIYRVESKESLIVKNAMKIRDGRVDLEFYNKKDSDFRFYYANNMKYAQNLLIEKYLEAVDTHGIDNVCLLSPFRKKTDTGVDIINPILRDILNPPSNDKKEVKLGSNVFREGDKVMETMNKDCISNGDIGYILYMEVNENDTEVVIDFNNGEIVEYSLEDLETVTLAYSMTIHKSQGSEYDSVLINIMDQHSIMLERNLLYTAITRSKKECTIVGSRSAVNNSIQNISNRYRNSLLEEKLKKEIIS